MILVGFCGAIGSGKTTFSSLIAEHAATYKHWESWQVIAEIANGLRVQPLHLSSPDDLFGLNQWLKRLPSLVLQATNQHMEADLAVVTNQRMVDHPDMYAKLLEYSQLVSNSPELQTGVITEAQKEQFRSILQWLGGFLAKSVDGQIWYDEIVRRIHLQPELELATVGGVRFPADAAALRQAGGLIIRIERPSVLTGDSEEVTERETHLILPNTTVHNDGTLEQLGHMASRVWQDLSVTQLQPDYFSNKQ